MNKASYPYRPPTSYGVAGNCLHRFDPPLTFLIARKPLRSFPPPKRAQAEVQSTSVSYCVDTEAPSEILETARVAPADASKPIRRTRLGRDDRSHEANKPKCRFDGAFANWYEICSEDRENQGDYARLLLQVSFTAAPNGVRFQLAVDVTAASWTPTGLRSV